MPAMFAPTGERIGRRPKHMFNVDQDFWEIQPYFAAPVLPGETLTNVFLQSRVVTPPIKSRTVGFWLEYFTFYVPFRQMPDAANLVAMFVDPSITLSNSAAAAHQYYDGRGYNFILQCLQAVVTEWFRREGEVWSAFTIRASRPAASIGLELFHDSLINVADLPDGGALAATQDDDIRAKMVLEYRRMLNISGGGGSDMDYEEVLASYGAFLRRAKERDRPELVRYIRQWSYPSNTVEPTTGVPSTAVSWSVNDRADKRRAFTEPGFLFGVTVIRPKVYYENQTAFAGSMLDRAQRWLPPMMDDAGMEKGLAEFATTQGPFGKTSGGFNTGYWLDVRDLFNHGDQYLDATAANSQKIAMPTTTQSIRYATQAMADSLKVTAGALCTADGSVQLTVQTRVVEPS